MSFLERIRKISADIKQQRQYIHSVDAAKQVSVGPFIQSLGYNLSNLNEVSPNYSIAGSWKYDFAIVVNGEPQILVRVCTDATTQGATLPEQLSSDLRPPVHRIGIITDGVNYRLYSPVQNMKSVDVELIMQFDLSEIDERSITNLRYLSKQEFSPNMIVFHATNVKQKNDIRSILEANYKQPSEEFVRFFAADMHSGVLPLGFVDELAPLVRQVFRDFVEGEHKERKSSPQPIITVPAYKFTIPVFATYKGHSFEGTLLYDTENWKKSMIQFRGKACKPSPSTLLTIRTVNPQLTNRVNGWSFWKLRDPRGNKEREISDLRNDNALVRRLKDRV